ncbi:serine/threonine protein kinase [Desulforhabdus amnigena]|uniref:Protein kinase domain-containing protein n=1 Tax=Desulforhabdus amnigena TaxID=40218 RepID=A0A9W6FX81_9BACT|nr:serine/threonine-protein kinase [Desulforhabdus amnigena]GLI36483.1 hypothetical protein DAMNIGENAA_39160 [Desulforhabdus amnigena]
MISLDDDSNDPQKMLPETVLLIRLTPEEVQQVQALLSHLDMPVESMAFEEMEDLKNFACEGEILLAILRVDGRRKRPDQDVRLLRNCLQPSVPLLLLVTPDQASRIKKYLRAGSDEFWILPLDSKAFPARFYVLLQWAQSAVEEREGMLRAGRAGKGGLAFLLSGMLECVRGWLLRIFYGGRERLTPDAAHLIAGKWVEVCRLGGGSFGDVWLVKEKETEKLAVAKIPHTPKLNLKFIREAAILRYFAGHPNAVQVLDVVRADGKVILIQEYVEGKTLQDLLDEGMDPAAKERAYLELLNVVSHGHEQNIMHRDIKPENILLTPGGQLKLLDFGTAKDLTRRSISSTVIGSRPYMAPEQIMGESRLTSDVWALGVVLYALATGFLPFYAENEKELMDSILETEPESPCHLEPEVPGELEKIILKCLQKDWRNRYRSAGELRAELLLRFPRFGEGKVLPG